MRKVEWLVMKNCTVLCHDVLSRKPKYHTDCAKDDESPIRYEGKNGLWLWEGPVGDPINIDSDAPCIADSFYTVQIHKHAIKIQTKTAHSSVDCRIH